MILFEEAVEIINSTSHLIDIESVELYQALGRVLAEDVYSDMDMPPFNKSAVDGYACKRSDLAMNLQVLEVIPAGVIPRFEIGEGECSKLMTGGMLPTGADVVIMVEDVLENEDKTIKYTGSGSSANYTIKGEDILTGDKVLQKGALLRSPEIAILATVGLSKPKVYRKPILGVISTGSELVEPDCTPATSQIRNSNAMQLFSQAVKSGCDAKYYGIAPDTEPDTFSLVKKASDECDIVILSGGVSAGDFDFVPKVIQQCGYKIQFYKLGVQPGKPVVYAISENKYLFGLPGNPVSSFVQFEMLVNVLIREITGNNSPMQETQLEMGYDFTRKKSERKLFFPVHYTAEGTVMPVEYHGSAHIHSYLFANGIAVAEIGVKELMKGSKVHVRLI